MDIGYAGAPVQDPCAVLTLIEPQIFTMKDLHVDIELTGQYTRGATVASMEDWQIQNPNVTCALTIDQSAYVDLLISYLHAYDGREVRI